ncbi:hypothetical protein F2P45_16900 [Massilia sp. CCM 8733]|uniref:Uncharacterized protein n=1 Tax=Massilia mucilaginosa TaxID=2609282 RepID=A0ABX0NVA7_9BURK|nr:hypothetical protein [Massilia mucilaginosa]NHZ90686.1 hypothetical protein [Massilia mucilaginosa]
MNAFPHKFLLALLVLLPCLGWARGIAFSEDMHGYAYHQGQYRAASVYFKVVIDDIDAWRANPQHLAKLSCELVLDRVPAGSASGSLQILAPGANGRVLTYRFQGAALRFVGIKHVYNNAGPDMLDDMTTLRGAFQAQGLPQPSVPDLLKGDAWTSELHFAWWQAATLWNFSWSFSTIATPWYEELAVKVLFLKTVFGDLARVLFPWAL